MKTRVIQNEPKPTEAPPAVPKAGEDAGEHTPADAPRAPEQKANGAKP